MQEFGDMEILEIVNCIEGDIQISEAHVYPQADSTEITGLSQEDNVPGGNFKEKLRKSTYL